MSSHAHPAPVLTRNQAAVYDVLSAADAPMTAYTILERLSSAGFRAPLQVYRALDKLLQHGMVHRLESLNAFVACKHPECDGHAAVAFTICDECGHVAEINDADLAVSLSTMTGGAGFRPKKTTIEIRGACSDCDIGTKS
jgi:Fur family zinc uptake transcriptional regulator